MPGTDNPYQDQHRGERISARNADESGADQIPDPDPREYADLEPKR